MIQDWYYRTVLPGLYAISYEWGGWPVRLPAGREDIIIEGVNKWKTVIQNAAKK